MEIKLTRGKVCLIDDEDLELVSQFRWVSLLSRGHWYAVSYVKDQGKTKHVLMHRLLLGLTEKNVVCDHIDGDGLNNTRSNLRKCSHGENMRNSVLRAHSSSGLKGVMLETCGQDKRKRWRGNVRIDGVRHRKWFKTAEEANAWCIEMRKKLHGEFAYEESRKD